MNSEESSLTDGVSSDGSEGIMDGVSHLSVSVSIEGLVGTTVDGGNRPGHGGGLDIGETPEIGSRGSDNAEGVHHA